ncbi:hypothetical protein DSCW_52070 [Desulfosarcina widdelii]|uniref:Uncharacterized protein n=1 Tax=Desulfosarcina widdelii TaxID=947919 RepID=A0A5K7ZAI6_9BACT|nr:hypothetical protein [Desulfosarcina widdelii]BBO77790.1 hypothetical protein DSCW_52070 [Desulfosarcina widdelii]
MKTPDIESLQDLVPHVQEHLLPQIHQAAEICMNCYLMDTAFNDMWTFGTQFWRNTWNRFRTIAEEIDECPFEVSGKGNEYKLRLGSYVLRHHRINSQSRLPSGAKSVKSAANHIQMSLFNDEWYAPVEKDNIVIAIDVDVHRGLKEVFLGEIMPLEVDSSKYKWVRKAPIFLVDGAQASTADVIHIADMPGFVPEEEIVEVPVKLDKSRTNLKGLESKGDK